MYIDVKGTRTENHGPGRDGWNATAEGGSNGRDAKKENSPTYKWPLKTVSIIR